jgi:hypothetical protein
VVLQLKLEAIHLEAIHLEAIHLEAIHCQPMKFKVINVIIYILPGINRMRKNKVNKVFVGGANDGY